MTPSRKPGPRLMELLKTDTPTHVGPVIWERVIRYLDEKVQGLDLRNSPEEKITGIAPQALNDWFRQYCDSRGGSEAGAYSRRQRQNIRLAFEVVRKRWEKILENPLWAIRNYPRSPRRGFIDFRGARKFQKGDLDRMRSIYASSVDKYGIFPRPSAFGSIGINYADELAAIKLFNLAFGLIANTGLTFPGCFTSICRLQRKHIPSQAQGALIIPRNASGSLWLSVTPDDISRIALISLQCHVSRTPKSQGIRRRQIHSLSDEEYLLGEKPTSETVCKLRAGFNQWLRHLARLAGANEGISLDILLQVAQIRLPEMYSAEVIASLTGKIHYHPLPPDQTDLGRMDPRALLADIEIPRWEFEGKSFMAGASAPTPADRLEDRATSGIEGTDDFPQYVLEEDLVRSFHQVCQTYIQGLTTAGQTARSLTEWGKSLLGCEAGEEPLTEMIKRKHLELILSNPTIDFPLWNPVNLPLVQRWNFACVAGWLAWRLTRGGHGRKAVRNTHTFEGYRRDVLALLRAHPLTALSEMGDEEMEEYFAGFREENCDWKTLNMEVPPPFRNSTISIWRSIRLYLSQEAGISLNPASLAAKSDERRTHFTRLVFPGELQGMLRICISRGTPEAYCSYLASLLAYYAGLRAIEIVRLRLSQIVVRGMPILFIRSGKGKKARVVLLDDAPASLVQLLKEARERRWRETGDLNTPLLPFPPLQTGDGSESDTAHVKKLSRWVTDIMTRSGLRSKTLIGDLPDLHRLRHSYINRSFLIRMDRAGKMLAERFSPSSVHPVPRGIDYVNDFKQISLNAGHATQPVTLEHYVHCLNMLQTVQLAKHQSGSGNNCGASLWLGRRAFEEILGLDHAQAHQILRKSGRCTWRQQGRRRMLGIGVNDALSALYAAIL
jgi:integrase